MINEYPCLCMAGMINEYYILFSYNKKTITMRTIIKKTLGFELLEDNSTWNITYTSGNIQINIQADLSYISQVIGKGIKNICLEDIEPLKTYIEADKAGVAIVSTVTTSTSKKEVFLNFERNINITVEDGVFATLTADDGRTYTGTLSNIHQLIKKDLDIMSVTDFDVLLECQQRKSQAV